ncbi:GIY-YIG nuclease family protein, partial [Acinetobacter baumannii]
NEQANSNFYTNFGGITENDTSTGYIYILKSQSKEPKIQSLEHLYKIGFSTTTVEKRIANAKKEPTYLMADVEVIAEYQAFNI